MDYAFIIPLESVQSGEWAKVADISGEPNWVGRMAEFGLQVGTQFKMIRGGCPCLIQVGDTCLSIRNQGCSQILVQPVSIA